MNYINKPQILFAIDTLAKVVEANKGWSGNETVRRNANKKIDELLKTL